VIAQIRAEIRKQTSLWTWLFMLVTLLGLVALAIVLHAIGLPKDMLTPAHNQLMVVGVGERLGTLFGALFGAVTVTAEFRHGTIRPTLLVAPRRWRVLIAKVAVAVVVGAVFGLVATALAAALGSSLLSSRGVALALTSDDLRMLIVGGGAASALWAAIGVGIGAVVRNQVPTLIGLSAWLLFIEGLLAEENSSFLQIGQYGPGAAATSISGMGGDLLLPPAVALAVLVAYAIAAAIIGSISLTRRDIA
jgi:ABC-2 type transport system permease protein